MQAALTQAANEEIGGQPEDGAEGGTQNYYLTIPITGLTTGWELVTENGGQYGYDNDENKDWNVAEGKLMLWLPVSDNECTVVLLFIISAGRK